MTKPKSKKGDKLVEDAGEQGACQSDEAQAVANSTDPVNLADIMEAIKSMNGSMNEKFDSLESTLSQTLVSLSEVTSRVTDLEKASADYEGRISELEAHCRDWFETCKTLSSKLDDLEGRSRRQNIKIIGLPEKVEEGRPTQFVADFLVKILGASNFPKSLKIDRAHRTGPIGNAQSRPRSMVARLHHYPDKEKILRLARLSSPLMYNGARILIFPDFTSEVLKQRQAFNAVRKSLKEANVRHGLLFPARLIVTHNSSKHVFDSAEKAQAFADSITGEVRAVQSS